MGKIEIRAFFPERRGALRDLFGRVDEGSPTASIFGHAPPAAAAYLDPYLDFAAESLFVAAVDGILVGYPTGCLDSTDFPSESARMDQAIRGHRLIFKAGPAASFARSLPDMAQRAIRRAPKLRGARRPALAGAPTHQHPA